VDIFSKQKRSEIMAKVKGKETKPEITLRKFLFSKGFRFRKNVRSLPGSPDIVLPKYRTIIFVHGCFWHGHTDCKFATTPKTRQEYWVAKMQSNKERDQRKKSDLINLGWKVIVIWSCEIQKVLDSKYDLISAIKNT
jgi:DNA mismatch endonuclease, patch repair protein